MDHIGPQSSENSSEKLSPKQRRIRAHQARRAAAKAYRQEATCSERLSKREEAERENFLQLYPDLSKFIDRFSCSTCGATNPLSSSLNSCCRRHFVEFTQLQASDVQVFGETTPMVGQPTENGEPSARTSTNPDCEPSGRTDGYDESDGHSFKIGLTLEVQTDLKNWLDDVYTFLSGSKLMDVNRLKREVVYRIAKSLPYYLARYFSKTCPTFSQAFDRLYGLLTTSFSATGKEEEAPEPTTQAWYSRLFATVKSKAASVKDCLKGALGTILDSIFSFAGTILGAIAGMLGAIMDKVKALLGRILMAIFQPVLNLKRLAEDFWDRSIKVIIVVVLLALACFGVASFALGFTISSLIVKGAYQAANTCFAATGGVEVFSIAMGLATLLAGGFSPCIEKTLFSKMKTLTALVAGGLIIGKAGMHLFYLLPTVLQHGLIRKFGTTAQVNELDLEDWMPQAMGLIKVSNIPEVLSSELYFNLVKEVVDKGSDITRHVPADRRSAFTIAHFQLMKILATLTRFQTEGSERTVPFCFHVCGDPGVGKSVILPHLIKEVFGYESKDMYYRPVESEFWNAYSGQPAVVYDEFLIGGTADPNNMGLAKEFLSCVSSSKFQPPLASVDQPTVGIKGTSARPRVVVTMNNNPYDTVPGIDNNALQRRRQFVLEIKVSPTAPRMPGNPNNVDLSGYTPEEIRTFPWMRFRVVGSQYYAEYTNAHTGLWYDYPNLITMIKDQVLVHETTQRNLMTAMARKTEPINVKELIEKELRTNYCMPKEEDSKTPWIDFFASLFTSGKFGATGAPKKKNSNTRTYTPNKVTMIGSGKAAAFTITRVGDGIVVVKNPAGKWMLPGGMKNVGESFDDCARRETLEEAGLVVAPLRTLFVDEKPMFRVAIIACTTTTDNVIDLAEIFRGRTTPEETTEIGVAYVDDTKGKIVILTPTTLEEDPVFRRGTYNHLMAGIQNKELCGDFFCERETKGHCPGHTKEPELSSPSAPAAEPITVPPVEDSSGDEYADAEEPVRLGFDPDQTFLKPAWMPPVVITTPPSEPSVPACEPPAVAQVTVQTAPELKKEEPKNLGQEKSGVETSKPPEKPVPTPEMLNRVEALLKPQDKQYRPFPTDLSVKDFVLDYKHQTISGPQYVLTDARVHRHLCSNHDLGCDNQVAVKGTDHGFLFCNNCILNNAHDLNRVFWTDRMGVDHFDQMDAAQRPDETDQQYWERVKEMFSKLKEGIQTRFDLVYSHLAAKNGDGTWTKKSLGSYIREIWYGTKIQFIKGFCIGYLFTMVIMIFSQIVKSMALGIKTEEPHELFHATSEGPGKNSRGRNNNNKSGYSRKGFKRSDQLNWRSTGNDIEMIGIANENAGSTIENATPIKGKWIALHSHVREKLFNNGPNVRLHYRGKEYTEKIDRGALFVDEENDFMLYEIQNRSFPSFSDNFNKFVTETEIADVKSLNVRFKARNSSHYASGVMAKNMKYDCKGDVITLERCYLSNFHSLDGDCGNYALITSGPLAGKILGLVVAGSTDGTARSLTTIITKDMLREVIDPPLSDLPLEEGSFVSTGCHIGGPNIISVETVPRRNQIHLPKTTVLKPSAIAPYLNFPVEKEPAVLSPEDPRSEGKDPILVGLNNLGENVQHAVDSQRLEKVSQDLLENYKDHLFEWPDRILTVREAIGGIPNYLASLKSDTSPGIPHVSYKSKQGKKDFFRFEEGELVIEPGFEELVQERIKEFQEHQIPDHTWAGYLKDELVSPAKVAECRTRIIYCGEVVSLVALRCLFGSTILRINNSRQTPSAIGINQYSNDLDHVHAYLTEHGADKFIAGDYKKFDQCMQEPFLKTAYQILGQLSPQVSPQTVECVYQHQVKSPLQMGSFKVSTVSDQKSGSLFTSIINNIVNELYMRYVFDVITPTQNYDEVVRGKFLGDDHVLGISGDTPFNGLTIRAAMKDIGQTYTSAEKTKELTEYENFEDITFLGAHPRKVNGRWTGALRKQTLYQAPMWTKDQNLTLTQTCQSMVELASQWDRDFYSDYKQKVVTALKLATGFSLEFVPYNQLQREVASRTSASGKDYFFRCTGFKATGNNDKTQELVTYMGAAAPPVELKSPPEHNDGRLAVKPSMTINDGTETTLYRTALNWTTTQVVGTTLFNYSLPFGLLNIGEQDNIQNMPFNRFIYWRGDVEITLQLSGTQFQQGALVLYFVPLTTLLDAQTAGMEEIATTLPHVFLHPGNSTTVSLRIPYRFFRTRLNTFAKDEVNETLGHMVLKVFSQLKDPAETGCTVSVFSKFPESAFSVPRPLSNTGFKATGNSNVSNYWIGAMMGRNSFEGAKQTGLNASLNASASAAQHTRATGAAAGGLALELDKPLVGGGAIPVSQKFPSLANTEGLDVTNVMSTCPNDLSQQHYMNVDPAETNIEKLCNRPMLLYRMHISPSSLPGSTLEDFPLNSIMFNINNMGTTTKIPFCLQVINMFCFWRADIVLHFMAFKTPFHSFRLKVVTGFGAPNIGTADNTYFTGVLDFSGDNREHKVVIPYNQVLEYLATYSGEGVVDPLQNGSLGHCAIKLMNKLVAPTNVNPNVEIAVFVSLQNVKVAHPRPYPFQQPSSLNVDGWYYAVPGAVPTIEEQDEDEIPEWLLPEEQNSFKATGNVDDSGQIGDGPVQNGEQVSIAGQPKTEVVKSCESRPSEKFIHPIGDFTELLRRPVRVEEGDLGGFNNLKVTRVAGTTDVDAWQIEPGMWNFHSYWYKAWAGSITIRIYSESPKAFRCIWIPNTTKCNPINAITTQGEINILSLDHGARVNTYSQTGAQWNVQAATNGQTTTFCGAQDESYPIGERNWTTITLPYTTNLDFTSTNYRWTPMPGTLLIVRAKDPAKVSFYVSAADDFRCIGLVPSPQTIYGLRSTGSALNLGFRQSFGGWINKQP